MTETPPLWDNRPLQPGTIPKQLLHPEAEILSELLLLRDELVGAHLAMGLYFTKYLYAQRGTEEHLTGLALFRDAVVRFTECFRNPKNDKPKYKARFEEVYADYPFEWEQDKEWFWELRNHYASHNHGAQRHYDVYIALEPDETGDYKTRIAGFYMNLRGAAELAGARIRSFMEHAIAFNDRRMEQSQAILREFIGKMDQVALLKLPSYAPPVPRAAMLSETRKEARQGPRAWPPPFQVNLTPQTPEPELDRTPNSGPERKDPDEESPSSESEPSK